MGVSKETLPQPPNSAYNTAFLRHLLLYSSPVAPLHFRRRSQESLVRWEGHDCLWAMPSEKPSQHYIRVAMILDIDAKLTGAYWGTKLCGGIWHFRYLFGTFPDSEMIYFR